MVVDCIMFNGEYDLWDIRYNILKDYVDEFIVCETRTTFSGKPKPLYFEKIKDKYEKVKYFIIEEDYTKEEIIQAFESPLTQGAEHWKHEFCQKERIKQALTHLNDEDVVFIADCDEIWNPIFVQDLEAISDSEPIKLKLLVYTYYLNNKSSENFWGILVGKYKDIKDACLNDLRNTAIKSTLEIGWHFTSLKDGLKRKLQDSYTKETYANDLVIESLDENIKNNKDFLGRNFKYWQDEVDWPEYLKKNKWRYKYLLK